MVFLENIRDTEDWEQVRGRSVQANGPRNTEEESVVRRAQHGGEEQASTGAPVCAKHGADVCKAQ